MLVPDCADKPSPPNESRVPPAVYPGRPPQPPLRGPPRPRRAPRRGRRCALCAQRCRPWPLWALASSRGSPRCSAAGSCSSVPRTRLAPCSGGARGCPGLRRLQGPVGPAAPRSRRHPESISGPPCLAWSLSALRAPRRPRPLRSELRSPTHEAGRIFVLLAAWARFMDVFERQRAGVSGARGVHLGTQRPRPEPKSEASPTEPAGRLEVNIMCDDCSIIHFPQKP